MLRHARLQQPGGATLTNKTKRRGKSAQDEDFVTPIKDRGKTGGGSDAFAHRSGAAKEEPERKEEENDCDIMRSTGI